jgi:hypothetical protein
LSRIRGGEPPQGLTADQLTGILTNGIWSEITHATIDAKTFVPPCTVLAGGAMAVQPRNRGCPDACFARCTGGGVLPPGVNGLQSSLLSTEQADAHAAPGVPAVLLDDHVHHDAPMCRTTLRLQWAAQVRMLCRSPLGRPPCGKNGRRSRVWGVRGMGSTVWAGAAHEPAVASCACNLLASMELKLLSTSRLLHVCDTSRSEHAAVLCRKVLLKYRRCLSPPKCCCAANSLWPAAGLRCSCRDVHR